MIIHDISMSIGEDMQVYKDKEQNRPVLTVMKDHTTGEAYETHIGMGLHTGTHMDAPLHMITDGDTIDKIPLNRCITKATVIDCTDVDECITKSHLEKTNIQQGDFVLLKTKNSYSEAFQWDFVYLERSGAQYLQQIGISGVGIDGLGIERNQEDHGTHKTLLGSGTIILEGLRLKHVKEGVYMLHALPLKIQCVEASPVRAILIEDETKHHQFK